MAELSMLDICLPSSIDLVRVLFVQETENLTQMGLHEQLTQKVLMAELFCFVSLNCSQMLYPESDFAR